MSLNERTRRLLDTHSLFAKKRFGQNFLVDGGVVADIAEAALFGADLHVIEIGPGLGALTSALLEQGADVVAIEKDPDLPEVLEAELGTERLRIVRGDALEMDFAGLHPGVDRPTVAGNIPYNISSPLLVRLVQQRAVLGPVTLMVQKEVADRWMAKPGSKTYGSPSVLIQVHADLHRIRLVPPQCFWPAPKVQSLVVRIDWLPSPRVPIPDPPHFERTVRAAFGQRRKTLRNALRAQFDREVVAEAEDAVDLGRRAETLSLAEFSALAAALEP